MGYLVYEFFSCSSNIPRGLSAFSKFSSPIIAFLIIHHNITWKFITERAPWWGGFYERLIGLMKRCLKKTLGKACLNMIELNTILTEVEAVLNSRPLTYPYTDINDASPLTPSHFLCGYRLLTLPDTNAKENEADPDYISI